MVQKKLPLINSAHGSETRNIINEIIKAINDRGLEILSESAFLNWLNENDFKPKEAVETLANLPSNPELKELRGVLDENAVYIYNGTKWVLQSNINFDGLGKVRSNLEDISLNARDYGALGDWNGVAGSDNTQALQNAINAAQTAKGRLLIPPGEYKVSGKLTITSPMRLEFSRGAKIISDFSPTVTTDAIVEVTSNDVTVENYQLSGMNNTHRGVAFIGGDNVHLKGGEISDVGMMGAVMEECSNGTIENVVTRNCMASGDDQAGSVRVAGGKNIYVKGCIVWDSHGKGISLGTGLIRGGIENCVIHDTLTGAGDGLYVGYLAKDIAVVGCEVLDPQGNAIKISRGASGTEVVNNVFNKTRGVGHALMIQGGMHSKVYNNTVNVSGNTTANVLRMEDHPNPQGSDCKFNKIYDNVFSKEINTSHNMYITSRSDTAGIYDCSNNEVRNNIVTGGLNGIHVESAEHTKVQGNTVSGVSNISINATSSDGISGIEFSNNTVYDAVKVGIQFYKISNSKITGNIVISTTNNPDLFGISSATGTYNNTIKGNHVKGFASRQIMSADPSSYGMIISENTLDCIGNGSLGIEFRGVEARIVNNIIRGSITKISVINSGADIVVSGNGTS